MLHLICCYEEEIKVSIILRCLIKYKKTFFMRNVNNAIRNTCYCE
jgi:hypothetical protein